MKNWKIHKKKYDDLDNKMKLDQQSIQGTKLLKLALKRKLNFKNI